LFHSYEVPKVLKNEDSGLLIKPQNEKEITDTLLFLLQNGHKANKMGRNGFKRVCKYFSSKKMSRKCLEIYGELLKA